MNCCKKIKNILFYCVIAILIVVGIIGFVSFFWNRSYFDFSRTIDDDLLGNLATFSMFVIALITLFFTGRDYLNRIKEKRPYLCLEGQLFVVKDGVETRDLDADNRNFVSFYQETKKVIPYLVLHNVGGGVAKNIKVFWTFDEKEIKDKLDKLKGYNYYTGDFSAEQKNDIIKWLLPERINNLKLPEYFMRQFGEKRVKQDASFDGFDEEIVKLFVKVTYFDIKDVMREQEFEINAGACPPNKITLQAREVSL